MSKEMDSPAADPAPEVLRSLPQRQSKQITTGAGIAIAGTWIAGSAVTITILITLTLDPLTDAQQANLGALGAVIMLFLIALPMIAAYSITKVILSKD